MLGMLAAAGGPKEKIYRGELFVHNAISQRGVKNVRNSLRGQAIVLEDGTRRPIEWPGSASAGCRL